MNWNVIVRAGENDNHRLPNIGEEVRFYVDFYRSNGRWKMRDSGLLNKFNNSGRLTPTSHDLLLLAMAVTSADRCIERKYADDSWQREITIHLPVSAPNIWENTRNILENALAFLSGDKWHFQFRRSLINVRSQQNLSKLNDICLFSGGADSLVGAIDLLSDGENITFVGHYGGGLTHSFQNDLRTELEKIYPGQTNFNFHYIVPPKMGELHYENTTRTRSFLFLSLAVAYGAISQGGVKLYVPENGLVSLNVAPTESRTGSLSTKTTHPYFIRLFKELLDNLGIPVDIVTPYKFKTKGEMFIECKNKVLLEELAKSSMSCSHSEQSRFIKGGNPKNHCGRCLPCLIRRAAFNRANIHDSDYVVDVLSNPPKADKKTGIDYRVLMMGIERFKNDGPSVDLFRVKSTGPVPSKDVNAFMEVYRRGMNELSQFLTGTIRQ
jgi:7-cyano-7-deazaguanine synthase in queuosine biosynthesis